MFCLRSDYVIYLALRGLNCSIALSRTVITTFYGRIIVTACVFSAFPNAVWLEIVKSIFKARTVNFIAHTQIYCGSETISTKQYSSFLA